TSASWPPGAGDIAGGAGVMVALSCAEARDLASDLLDGELGPDLERAVDEHVTGCPTCPSLYRALLAVHHELERLRHEEELGEGSGAG
ncbi:MAG TPA: zf-HC2 domain-containing protein, partial [Candidatus Micrarchaeaceae archaeon]|nr:zf-HC2 domain-containing protein [Candidatus Micrarchaeaceae archaeon]